MIPPCKNASACLSFTTAVANVSQESQQQSAASMTTSAQLMHHAQTVLVFVIMTTMMTKEYAKRDLWLKKAAYLQNNAHIILDVTDLQIHANALMNTLKWEESVREELM